MFTKLILMTCFFGWPKALRNNIEFVRDEPATNKVTDYDVTLEYYTLEEEKIRYDLARNQKLHALISSLVFTPYKFLFRKQTKIFKLTSAGILSSVGSLDRERLCASEALCQIRIDVGLQVKDMPLKNIKILIMLEDINDHPPTFENHRMVLNVSENEELGYVVALPSASDSDGPKYGIDKYQLEEIGERYFFDLLLDSDENLMLDSSTHHLSYKNPRLKLVNKLDRENKDLHRLRLIAYDKGIPNKSGMLLIGEYIFVNCR